MSGRLTGALLALVLSVPLLAEAPPSHVASDDPLILASEDKARVDAVGKQLICYCGCARTTIKDCECGVADAVRKSIWNDLGQGRTPEQIIEAYLAQYGEQFRSMPEAKGLGVVAWTLPYAAIVLAVIVIIPVAHRWTRPKARQGLNDESHAAEPNDELAARVDKELSDLD